MAADDPVDRALVGGLVARDGEVGRQRHAFRLERRHHSRLVPGVAHVVLEDRDDFLVSAVRRGQAHADAALDVGRGHAPEIGVGRLRVQAEPVLRDDRYLVRVDDRDLGRGRVAGDAHDAVDVAVAGERLADVRYRVRRVAQVVDRVAAPSLWPSTPPPVHDVDRPWQGPRRTGPVALASPTAARYHRCIPSRCRCRVRAPEPPHAASTSRLPGPAARASQGGRRSYARLVWSPRCLSRPCRVPEAVAIADASLALAAERCVPDRAESTYCRQYRQGPVASAAGGKHAAIGGLLAVEGVNGAWPAVTVAAGYC